LETHPRTADDNMEWLPPESGNPVIRFKVRTSEMDAPGWVLRLRFSLNETEEQEATEWLWVYKWKADGSSEDDRSVAFEQKLEEHQKLAEERMHEMVDALKLPKEIAEALCFAARVHDEGKNCAHWQDAFRAPIEGRPYAKTKGPISQRLLNGYRHELISMMRAQEHEDFRAFSSELQELTLHIIAAHHGFARPFIGIAACDGFPPSALAQEAREIALRFTRLQKQWGPWGLAWLESLLRAADQQASRDPEPSRNITGNPSHE